MQQTVDRSEGSTMPDASRRKIVSDIYRVKSGNRFANDKIYTHLPAANAVAAEYRGTEGCPATVEEWDLRFSDEQDDLLLTYGHHFPGPYCDLLESGHEPTWRALHDFTGALLVPGKIVGVEVI
jgi:hypothetical protein